MRGSDSRGLIIAILLGIVAILFVALGVLYVSQMAKQRQLTAESARMRAVLSAAVPDSEKLKAAYDEVTRSLAPRTTDDLIALLVSSASASGIDTRPESGRLDIPPQQRSREEKVVDGKYLVTSLGGVRVQGSHSNVVAFISSLSSGEVLKTLVLKRVDIRQVEVVEKSAAPAPASAAGKPPTGAMTDAEIELMAGGSPAGTGADGGAAPPVGGESQPPAGAGTDTGVRVLVETVATLDIDVYARPG